MRSILVSVVRRALLWAGYSIARTPDTHPERANIKELVAPDGDVASAPPPEVTAEWLASLASSNVFRDRLVPFFAEYPARSLMSTNNRALIYSLIRALRPQRCLEIGTFRAGTTEVIARALWANGSGVVHTVDPYSPELVSACLAQWPQQLQSLVRHHGCNSMSFFAFARRAKMRFDLALIDGDHSYEGALFDVGMAARALQPGGLMLIDNAEQAGPFEAARAFTAGDSGWRELGNSLSSFAPAHPFSDSRGSVYDTNLLVLQKPSTITLSDRVVPSGEQASPPQISGLTLAFPPQRTKGRLHVHTVLRAFAPDRGEECKRYDALELNISGEVPPLRHTLSPPLSSQLALMYPNAAYTIETELFWESDDAPLLLCGWPAPCD